MNSRTVMAYQTCACFLCMLPTATKPAVGQTVSPSIIHHGGMTNAVKPGIAATTAQVSASANPSASITTTPTPQALAILAEVAVLGFTYRLVKRRKAELAAFYAWCAGALEPFSDTAAKRVRDREPPREEEQSGIEKRSTLGQRRGQAKSPLGRQPRLSPQR